MRPCSIRLLENAVSREGFRGYFASNATKAKQSSKNVYVNNLLQFLCPSALEAKREDIKKRWLTLAEVIGQTWAKTRRKRQIFIAIGAVLERSADLLSKQGNLAVLNWHQVYP